VKFINPLRPLERSLHSLRQIPKMQGEMVTTI